MDQSFALENLTQNNENYRKVIYTAPDMQLVLMSLSPLQNIPEETHPRTTQFIRIESGNCIAVLNDAYYDLKDGDAIIIPHNTEHEIINSSRTTNLKLYTIYSRAEHAPNTFEAYKHY